MFAAAALAALRAVLTRDFDDVEGVVDHGGVRYGAAHAVSVADGVEVEYVLDVYAAGGEDLHVLESVAVELPAHLLHQVPKVAAAVTGGIEPDGGDRVRDGAGGDEGAELLVVEGVDEDRARYLGVYDLVEGPRGLGGRAQDEDQGVGEGAGGGDAEPPGGELHRDPVAAAEVGGPLYHGRDRGVHPPRPEGDDRSLARGEPASGGPRRHPRSLAQKAQDRSLVLGEGAVGTGEGQHRLVGAADRTLRDRPRLRLGSLQKPGHLVQAGDYEPFVGIGGLVGDLGVNRRVFETSGAQDLHRPVEVDVGDLAALDLLVRGSVETCPFSAVVLFAQSREPSPLACLRHMIANKGVNKSRPYQNPYFAGRKRVQATSPTSFGNSTAAVEISKNAARNNQRTLAV